MCKHCIASGNDQCPHKIFCKDPVRRARMQENNRKMLDVRYPPGAARDAALKELMG
jgi:hypothetical protein